MALGKRKEREEEERHGSTLFVSNLPYNTTSTDLQTLFSDIAPVRNAFVVCEFGTGVSKGVGYVSFAMREDAQLAFDKINTEGLTLVGRKLRIQWAETKVKKDRSDTNDQKKPSQKVQPQPRINRISQDPLAIRTVIISGLSPSIDSKSLWKKIRKYQGAEKIEWPVLGGDGVEDSSSAHALFSTPALALDAVNKLHAHVFKGSLLSVTLKKRLDILVSHKAPSANLRTTPSHAHRLIIRNIPFSATAQDLRSIFLPYGPIHSINVPLKEPVSPKSELAKAQKDEAQHDGGVLQTRPERNKGFACLVLLPQGC
ncbi:hypothetical protein APHAL10511_004190 [Amanita phalloides]|nr:hypothetical protein APHAL10511_004190 [Amanita phalloides]